MKTSAAEVLAVARRELGVTENPPNSNHVKYTIWYGQPYGWAWCNIFVDYCLKMACNQNGEASPLEGLDSKYGPAYTPNTYNYAKQGRNGLGWSEVPVVGALALYDWAFNSGDICDHIGFVEEINIGGDRNAFHAIEGNTSGEGMTGSQSDGGGVFRRLRRNDRGYVRGFVLLPYGKGAPPPPPPPGTPAWPGVTLGLASPLMGSKPGAAHDMAARWQQRMKDRGWAIGVDGIYGPQSVDVCKKFQAEKHLGVDGQVGPVTWTATFRTDNVT